ncbi:hypothetical protein DRO54_05985 [Candidatus Bathyarchaeota archaeon]|nr:MAG: hypothetical protein DRO54_05985 [Candidatus Bathyarchaeota archaeon]
MSKLIKIEPFELPDDLIYEIYFSKFFPIEQLIKKGLMKRTKYGITVTKEFKERIIRQIEKLQLNQSLASKFRRRRYLEMKLEKLWNPIVCAVAETNRCEYVAKRDGIYVPLSLADTIRSEASAIYQWFRHVKNILEKASKNNFEIMGEYV